jgi:DNA-binding FadR family transcriptional regulator
MSAQSSLSEDRFKPIETPTTMANVTRHLAGSRDTPADPAQLVRDYLRDSGLGEGQRLPAERELSVVLGLPRSALRQALTVLDSSGEVWRHVGKGTFVGRQSKQTGDELAQRLAQLSNPMEVIEARLMIEPKLAALAALRGSEKSFSEIERLIRDARTQRKEAELHRMGDEFHHAVARAAGSSLLMALFEVVFRVRGLTSWGRLRPAVATRSELSTVWGEHEEIFAAIKARDPQESSRRMHMHIESIQRRIALGHEIHNPVLPATR